MKCWNHTNKDLANISNSYDWFTNAIQICKLNDKMCGKYPIEWIARTYFLVLAFYFSKVSNEKKHTIQQTNRRYYHHVTVFFKYSFAYFILYTDAKCLPIPRSYVEKTEKAILCVCVFYSQRMRKKPHKFKWKSYFLCLHSIQYRLWIH